MWNFIGDAPFNNISFSIFYYAIDKNEKENNYFNTAQKACNKISKSISYIWIMAKQTKYHLEIEIDKLTNSILNKISGDSFPTDTNIVSKADVKIINKKNGWLFNWSNESKLKDRQVYKLTIRNNPDIVQGLISISDFKDYFYLHFA